VSWSTAALGEVCDVVSGATPRTSEKRFWDGGVLWTTPKDISDIDGPYLTQTTRTITEEGLKSCAATILPPNSVLLSSRAPIGLVAINSVPMATNQGYKSLVPNAKRIDSKFLFYWLRSKTHYLQSLGNGATFKEISKAVVERIEVPLPTLDEQRRLAAILDKADALRRKRKRALDLLDGLTQSIFLEMFGDPLANPMRWPEKPLSDYESFLTSGSRGWAKYYSLSGRAFIRIQNLRGGALSTEDLIYVDPPDDAEARRTKVQAGDVLISITADLGRTAVVPKSLDGRAHINQHIALVRPKGIDPTYLSMFLAGRGGQKQFEALNRHGVKAGLNFDNIRSLSILVPPVQLQRDYVVKKRVADDVRVKLRSEIAVLDNFFGSLQHRAFAGQL